MAIFKLSPNVQLRQQTEERQVSIPVGCIPSAFVVPGVWSQKDRYDPRDMYGPRGEWRYVAEGCMVPERGYGGTTLPPPMNRQTRVKTLPSRNFVSGW